MENRTLLAKDYRSQVKPIWCPRCGDFGFMSALLKSFEQLGIPPHETVVVSGIGCAGRIPAFIKTYGFHGVHGRVLPIATGIKLANPNLNVLAIGGDGDGFAIGMGHFPHAIRRNVGLVYFVLDNSIYGLTKGQSSPTTPSDHRTRTNPYGLDGEPLDPVSLALSIGAGFVARIFSGHMQEMLKIIPRALRYQGFAFVHVLSPCSTFYDTFGVYKERVRPLPEDFETHDRLRALEYAADPETIYSGVFVEERRETLEERLARVKKEQQREDLTIKALARSMAGLV